MAGKQKVIDKVVRPLQVTSLTPGGVTGRPNNQLGVLPIGVYKGEARFIDLDKLVNQPLVLAEMAYALGRVDDRDKATVSFNAGAALDSSDRARIEVPAGEVWYLNRLVADAPAADIGGAYLAVNIRISIWPDTASTPDADGRAYWSASKEPKGTPETLDLPAQGELGEELRLPGGSTITLVAAVKVADLTDAQQATLTPYGRKGKVLVD